MTPTLATIRFESAYLLCHVNAIDSHLMRIQFDSLWMRIETGLQRASCERPLNPPISNYICASGLYAFGCVSLYVYLYIYVCQQKNCLFTTLPLKNLPLIVFYNFLTE